MWEALVSNNRAHHASDFHAQPGETFLIQSNSIKIDIRKRFLKQGVYFIEFEKGTFGNN